MIFAGVIKPSSGSFVIGFMGRNGKCFALWDHEDRGRRARVASQLCKDAVELAVLEIAELSN